MGLIVLHWAPPMPKYLGGSALHVNWEVFPRATRLRADTRALCRPRVPRVLLVHFVDKASGVSLWS